MISNAAFDTDLRIERKLAAVKRDGAKVDAILVNDYRVSFDMHGARCSLCVPAGFGASPSVPPKLASVVPFWGALFEASIAHDWAYYTRCFDPHGGRDTADTLLYQLMIAGGTRLLDAAKVLVAVRVFGGSHYDRYSYRPNNNLLRKL